MADAARESRLADGVEEADTHENMKQAYANLKNCDPNKDIVIIEVNGEVVGYKRVTWWEELDGTRIYGHFGFLKPEWRGKGIGHALFKHSEARLREIAAGHPEGKPHFLDTGTPITNQGLLDILRAEGYEPVRSFYEMVRPDLENLPDVSMPDGLEIRPVRPEHYRTIWEAEAEAFRDHWGESPVEEEDYKRWLEQPLFQPEIWTVAWDGEQVAGIIRNYINEFENNYFNRKRGYTENISVRRPWRRRGLARALIARSFQIHKELGMTEAALGVDADNPSGARQLYENMGFKTKQTFMSFRKPM